MERLILDHEPALRLAAFVGALAAVALAELAAPRRPLRTGRRRRWAVNLAIAAVDAAALRLTLAGAAVGAAVAAEAKGFGLFNALAWPPWLEFVCAAVLLDLAVYFQHVLFHATPALWRFHMMHHSDLDIDVTTGARFHIGELLVSMVVKAAAVAALGAPAAAVILFEVLLNASSMFNHGNIALPARVDRRLRLLVVTPDMHRVHHSASARETDSNFGFGLSCWDRLFGTYRAQPGAGHEAMDIGLERFRDPARLGFFALLAMPFARGGDARWRTRQDSNL